MPEPLPQFHGEELLASMDSSQAEAQVADGYEGDEPARGPEPADGRYDVEDGLFLVGWLALAGGCYPVILALFFLVGGGVACALDPSGKLMAAGARLMPDRALVGGSFLLSFVLMGFFYSAVAAFGVLKFVSLVLRTLDWQPRWDRLGAFCGGLTALLLLGWPIVLLDPWSGKEPIVSTVWFLAGGPGLGTIVFQSFGARGGISMMGRDAAERMKQLNSATAPTESFRFSLWQAMWLISWLCVGLTILRAASHASVGLVGLVCLWVPFQMVSGPVVLAILWRRQAWRQKLGSP